MSLQDRIKEARKRARFSQERLASSVQVTRGAVQQWEKGTHRPHHEKIVRLAEALDVSMEWLLMGEEPSVRQSGVPVVGDVARGIWFDPMRVRENTMIPIAPVETYPAEMQCAFEVVDDSAAPVATRGEYLHAVYQKGASLVERDGDIVVAKRESADGALHELTANRILENDAAVFEFYPLDGGEPIHGPAQIVAIVIGRYKPIPRGER